jgi:hypothetical protein
VAERSGDTAFDFTDAPANSAPPHLPPPQSAVTPLFPLAAAVHIKPPRKRTRSPNRGLATTRYTFFRHRDRHRLRLELPGVSPYAPAA